MRRILFVDDEAKILDGLRRSLRHQRKEWEMVFCESGNDAVEQMKQAEFDVIVTDMRMPGMNGAEVLDHAQRHHPGIVRIMLSGHSEEESAMRAVNITHQFLSKPCESGALKQVVDRACQLQQILADETLRAVLTGVDRLPSLPTTFAELGKVLADPECTFKDVAGVVSRDTAMSAKIIQIVNSSFFGLAQEVTNLEQGVSYLGMEVVRDLVLSTEIFRPLEDTDSLPGFDPETEQQHTLLVAELARSILKKRDKRKADDAFLAGLLHDLGKMILAWKRPDVYADAVQEAEASGRPRWQVERERLGVTHAEVGAYLLGVWGLPYPIVEAVAFHHEPGRIDEPDLDVAAALHVADALVGAAWEEAVGASRGHCAEPDPAFVEAIGVSGRIDAWREKAEEMVASVAPGSGEADGDIA